MTPDEQPRPEAPAPDVPALGPAADHLAAAEQAAGRGDFDAAVRERFRAVVRGLEQRGVLEVRRARTARETADAALATVPEQAAELPTVARGFDEVVYGGRRATPDEYERLAHADRFSQAPPPPPEAVEVVVRERSPRGWRRPPPLPELLRNPRFWAIVLGVLVAALIVYLLVRLAAAPTAPPPRELPQPPDRPGLPRPNPGEGTDSIFQRLPDWLAYGGLQLLICAAIVVWWRARRRGALVGEPRPVEVAAGELLAGQARLYRRSGDREHVAATLRAATLRRIRPTLGLAADAPPDRVVTTIAARLGTDPRGIGAALFGPVPDDQALQFVVAQLDRIESELG
ncbi:DUF4129 domain-containing protein [Nocardia sp. CDC159]|uniref:DUF4129 domain-containing protein n=1 Tax=Nocardia pulmonis TaxID=2951408 RepID=A0A9X2IYY8_9NOCA|nr:MULTISPECIES: DUF4129 domain-containing protein [Nocardia]MCM6776933.1 DUF4129 domain-containing protein [Nocardia pulmonis]MCM6789357.1 DUF4129 domain-containing protein [Nocardia sp. CDC159]